jgi:DoxX-like protein
MAESRRRTGMYEQATVEGTGASHGLAAKSALWAGRVVSALLIAFLLFDAGIKVMMLEPAVEGSVRLGYPEGTVFEIGLALLVGTLLYAVPRTAFVGTIVLTGYLGGAVATQVRVEDP